jgi:hypothetical protein
MLMLLLMLLLLLMLIMLDLLCKIMQMIHGSSDAVSSYSYFHSHAS